VYILFSYRSVWCDANKSIDYLLRYCCRVFWLVVNLNLCVQMCMCGLYGLTTHNGMRAYCVHYYQLNYAYFC